MGFATFSKGMSIMLTCYCLTSMQPSVHGSIQAQAPRADKPKQPCVGLVDGTDRSWILCGPNH